MIRVKEQNKGLSTPGVLERTEQMLRNIPSKHIESE
jgi:hypothetical protein